MKEIIFFGVDSASHLSSVFLGTPERVIFQLGFPQKSAMESLVNCGRWLWEKSGVSQRDVDAFLVNRGPGSLTGIKIGIAYQMMMGKIFRKPVIGISGLDALAFSLSAHCPGEGCLLLPLIRAVRNEYYFAFYEESKPVPRRIGGYERGTAERLVIPGKYRKVVMGGDGAQEAFPLLSSRLEVEVVSDLFSPTALSFLVWGKILWEEGRSMGEVEPLYLYPPPIHLKVRE
ncbi:MAG: tRNA (adenosine(37)-N6)-threonylcarbamoyltransferase complex dimerization subunit type 1 TsaB [bacterium JZ-2024 1]